MPRAIWTGHLTFGLVSIPVGLHAALESSERVSFRLLHRKDKAPIRYKKFCSKEDREIPNDEIVRGYEVEKGHYAVVEEEEIAEIQGEMREEEEADENRIDIVQFVEFSSLNPLLFEKPYYLTPQKGGAKPYGVLREALCDSRKVGIARFFLRKRPLLAAVVPGTDVLSLEVMRDAAELRNVKRLTIKKESARPNEVKMARALIDQMSGEWDPTEQPNVYRQAIEKLIAGKPKFDLEAPEAKKERPGKVVDLMQALKDSLEGERKGQPKRAPRKGRKQKRAA